LNKVVTYVPIAHAEKVLKALFEAGAGSIGDYLECSFSVEGKGTFKAGESADPFVGKIGERHEEQEQRLEVIVEGYNLKTVLSSLISSHPYEEVAYEVYKTENQHPLIGSGMVGDLEEGMSEMDFMKYLKKALNVECIRHTALRSKTVKKVAFCGGSGSFLLKNAIAAKADVFITGDFKYHDFFDSEGRVVIMDVGHYESEQFTIELIAEKLQENFPIFAVLKTKVNTNPISYF
jgi:hypothetical protein